MLDSAMFGYQHSTGQHAPDSTRLQNEIRSSSAARKTQREVQYLEDRFERLSLVCMAMWSLLQDKAGATEAELMERVQTIDLMDGRVDGKASKVGVVKCVKCDRPMSDRHLKCIYCGAEKQASSAFDRV